MDDFTNALSALGVAPAAPKPAGYANEGQMRTSASGDMGADPQAAIREINTTQKQMAASPNLDAASRKMLQDHIAEMGRQLKNIPDASASTAALADDDFSGALAHLNAPAPAQPQSAPAPSALIETGAPADPHAPITSPAFDLAANQASALGSTVAGGFGGLYSAGKTLLKGGSLDDAVNAGAKTVQDVQQAGTYQPRTEQGAKMVEQFGSNYNPLSWIPNATQYVGDKAGDALAASGMPGAGAVVKGIGVAAPLALGMAVKPLSSLLKGGADVAEVPRVEPTMNPSPAAKPRYKMVDGKPVLIEETNPQPSAIPAVTPSGAPAGAESIPRVEVRGTSASMPAPRPSIADASPELQKAVADLQQKGVPVNPTALARHVEADTLPVPVKMTAGQASMNPALISEEMNSRGKAQPTVSPDFYNAQGKALGANLDALRAKAAPDVTATHPAEMGQALVDQYKAVDAPIRADITAKYKALADANGGNLPMSGQDFVNAADAAMKKGDISEWLPEKVQAKLESYRNGAPMSFDNFENMRTILANEARKAGSGPSPDGNAVHAIGVVRDALESLPMSGEAAAIKPLADAARGAAKARFDALRADPAYKAAINDTVGHGEPSPLAEKFVQNYLINGKGANVKQMKANLATSDIANQTIAAAGIDYLKGLSGADPVTGKFLADRYNKGVNQLGPKLGDMFDPQTAQHLQQVGNVAKYTSAQPKGSFVNNSNTLVGAMAEAGKGTLEGMANNAALGVPVGTWIRKAAQNRSAAKASAASVEPGAGIKLSDIGK
jgi:hypothetical protein